VRSATTGSKGSGRRLARGVVISVFTLGFAFTLGLTRVPIPVIMAVPPRVERSPSPWPRADGVQGTHHSALREITAANVNMLERAWVYRTGDVATHSDGRAGTAFEATPIMVDGVLYLSTPFSRVVALDAETGEERWTFDPHVDRSDRVHTMLTSRGVATWLDPRPLEGAFCHRRIFLASYDARLFALDAKSGAKCSDFGDHGVVDLGLGVPRIEGRRGHYKQTAPPTVVGDLVVVGSSIFDNRDADAPSGVVRALDTRTGEERWRWDPVAGVGGVDEDGVFVPAGAANVWATMTVDEARDLLFVPTASPSPDHFGGLRPGANAYANSLVALRASSGEVVWHFQVVHHDLWDYDLPAAPALITVPRNGRNIPAVVLATKMGYVFVFHRETGEPLFPIEERPVPASDVPGEEAWPTQPVPLLPRPLARQGLQPDEAWGLTPFDRAACRAHIESLRHDGPFAPPSLRGTVVMPGFIGGHEWGGVAWDPAEGLMIANANQVAMVATLVPRDRSGDTSENDGNTMGGPQRRTPFAVRRDPLLSPIGLPCNPPPWGTLAAVDMGTGEVRWEVPLGTVSDLTWIRSPSAWGSPNLGGPLATGGLVFVGATMDRRFRAFDVRTGRLVWEDELPASAQATPMTYRARRDGRQYIVVAAGGHAGMKTRLGDHLVAYALPEAEEPLYARQGDD
jgi:quinoprotein glucose dehydrogenase